MNLLTLVRNWKDLSTIWAIIQPFIVNLVKKNVPTTVTKLYENLAKHTQPAIDSLFNLKNKIKESPSELDDYCFDTLENIISKVNTYQKNTFFVGNCGALFKDMIQL